MSMNQKVDVQGYDVIGDIHGHADALMRLLKSMGYFVSDGAYKHPTRVAVFAGDFVDRGPQQRETLDIARAMVGAGAALAVMGNHEFNAIAYMTADENGEFLRPHTDKNRTQHRAFLDQLGERSQEHADAVSWFRSLPLWLDFGGLRVVHACWCDAAQQALTPFLDARGCLTELGLFEVHNRGSSAYQAAEILLKGPEVTLPNGRSFVDKDGHRRHEARLRWWDRTATTFRTAALGMKKGAEGDLPNDPVPLDFIYRDTVPVLFGHYWMRGTPRILQANASCLDFSVAKGGFLSAYRWSGEAKLVAENLVSVPSADH